MALSTKLSEAFKDFTKQDEYRQRVEKYDISSYTNMYNEINDSVNEMTKITKKYIQPEEIEKQVLIDITDYKGSQTIRESNKMITYTTNQALFVRDGDPPDDSNRRPTANIQNELLKVHKVKDFASIEKNKNDKLVSRYNSYKARLITIQSNLSAVQQQQQQQRNQAYIKAIKFIKYSSTVILCVVNYVVLTNIFNPVSWVNIGLSMYNNKYVFRFFSDIMGYFNLFNTNDLSSLDTLFKDLQLFLKTKDITDLTPEQRDEYVKMIIQKVFQPSTVKTEDITAKFSFHESNSSVEKFFSFIYTACQKLNIFDNNSNINLQQDWLSIVYQFSQSPYGMYGMSQIGLIFNTLAYFERAESVFNQYSEINPMIIFEEISNQFLQSSSFAEYNKLISSKMLEKILPENTTQVISEVPFLIDWFGSEMNVNGQIIKQLTKDDVRGFFVTTTESLTSILVSSSVNGYFFGMKKEAESKQVNEDAIKTLEDKILDIETNIRKRGKYVSKGLSDERIASLLSEAPRSNDYKFFAFRFVKDFYNYFGDIIDDPVIFVYTLTSSISLTKILEALLKPGFLTTSVYAIQNLILNGMYNTNLFSIPVINFKIKIKNVVSFILSYFLGNDKKLNKQLNLLRTKIIGQITNDIQVLLADISKVFFDTRIGIKIESYINKINSVILGKIFTMSCKIIYYIVAVPQFQLYLSRQIPESDIKLFDILRDKNTMVKYFTVIRNKISNLFTLLSNNQQNTSLLKELKSFFEIHKIVFKNVIPFVANNGYYFYDVNKPFEFKGNGVKILNELFVDRLEREEKKPKSEQENLLEYQPKSNEIGEDIIIINNDTNGNLITVDKKNIIQKALTIAGISSIPANQPISIPGAAAVASQVLGNRNDEIFYFYYYKKFVDSKKQQNPQYNVTNIDKNEFDHYLSSLSNNLRNNFSTSNGIEYAIINDIRASFEENFENLWYVFFSKTIEEKNFILTSVQKTKISNLITQLDTKGQKVVAETIRELNNIALDNSIITIPYYTSYGSSPIRSNMSEFLKTTEILNLIESNEQSQNVVTKYEELETLAVINNNNNIYSELQKLDYTLSKQVKQIIKHINTITNYVKKYLPGKEKTKKDEDEYGVSLKHLGFNYDIFTTKIINNLKNTLIGSKNEIFLDKIDEFLDIDVILQIIIDESEIVYVCNDGTNPPVFLDHSKSIDLSTGNKYDCPPTNIKDISTLKNNKDIIKRILFTPEVLFRLYNNFKNYKVNTKYKINPSFISNYQKVENFFKLLSKIVDGINVNGQELTTIYDVIDKTIEETTEKSLYSNKIDAYKIEILKNFQITLRESVKRGYVDKDLLKQINNFFKRKEVLLDRYVYINEVKTLLNNEYSTLLAECSKFQIDPNTSTAVANSALAELKKIIISDRFTDSFTLSKVNSTKPGGSENFGLLDMKNFNEEKNALMSSQSQLESLRTTLTTGLSVLTDINDFCSVTNNPKNSIKEYIDSRNNSLDQQFELYKITLLNVSENIFSELKRYYSINSTNIKKLLKTYEKEIEKLKNKFIDKNSNNSQVRPPIITTPIQNLIPQGTSATPQSGQNVSPSGPSMSPQLQEKPTPQQAKDLKSAEKTAQKQSEKIKDELKEEIGLKEEQEQGHEESLQEELSEEQKLQLSNQLGFSGSDNTFNYMANLINILPPISTTVPETDLELEKIETKDIKQENKNALEVCKSYSGKWTVEYQDPIYDITTTIIDKQEAIACSSNNLLVTMFDYINSFFVNIVSWLTSILKSVGFNPAVHCSVAGLATFAVSNTTLAFIFAISCVIIALGSCVVYIWQFCLSYSIKTIIQNKLSNKTEPNIALKFLTVVWFYSAMSLNKIVNEKQVDDNICIAIGLDKIFERIYPEFSISDLAKGPREILSQFDTTNKIDSNGIGMIDLGQSESNGINFNNPKDMIDFLKNFIDSNDQLGIDNLMDKVNNKTIGCIDFNFNGNQAANNLRYVIYGTIQQLVLLNEPKLLLNYMGCLMVGDVDAWENLKSGGILYFSWAFTQFILNLTRIFRAIQDVFILLISEKKVRPVILFYFFGSSSTNKTKNLGREIIEEAIKLLETQYPNNTDFTRELKKDVDTHFGSFFTIFTQTIGIVWQAVTDLFMGPRQNEIFTLDKNLISNYDYFVKSKVSIDRIFSDLVEPSINLVQDNSKIFSSIDASYVIHDINNNDEIFTVLQLMNDTMNDSTKEEQFYDSFVFNNEQKYINNDVTKNTVDIVNLKKKKKTIINQYINILKFYKKRFDTRKAIDGFVLINAKNNPSPWFNLPFSNYMAVQRQIGGDTSSAIYYHLLKPCENDEILIVKQDASLNYIPECIKIPIKYTSKKDFDVMFFNKYETYFNDFVKQKLDESHQFITEITNITTNFNNIISSLNTGLLPNSTEYIDVVNITNSIDDMNQKYVSYFVDYTNKLTTITAKEELKKNYYNTTTDMLKKYIGFINQIKDKIIQSITEYKNTLKSYKETKSDMESKLIDYTSKGKEPNETDDDYNNKIDDLKFQIENLKNLIDSLEKKININENNFNSYKDKLQTLSSGNTYENVVNYDYKKIMLQQAATNDPLYFAYLYTNVINKINRYNIDLLEIFKVICNSNLTIQEIKTNLNFSISKNKYFFDDDNLNTKIIDYKDDICNILGFYISQNNEETPIGAYRQITTSGTMYINETAVKSTEEVIKAMPSGKDILTESYAPKGTLRKGFKLPIYKKLSEYGYYIKVSTIKDLQHVAKTPYQTSKLSNFVENSIPLVMFGKITTKGKQLFESNKQSDWFEYFTEPANKGLFEKNDYYLENNGSITKFDELIPPILIDYTPGEFNDLDSFVTKNYVSYTGTNIKINVLKSNLELYKRTYKRFDETIFFQSIENTYNLKKRNIEEYKKTFYSFSPYSSMFNLYDEFYDVRFDYFNNLDFNNFENINFRSIEKIKQSYTETTFGVRLIDNIRDWVSLISICPISVFQSNINNLNFNIDPNSGDITKMNYVIIPSDITEV